MLTGNKFEESRLPGKRDDSLRRIIPGFQEGIESASYASSTDSMLRDVLSQLTTGRAIPDSLDVLPKPFDLISGLRSILTDLPGSTGEESSQNEPLGDSDWTRKLSGLSETFSHMANFSLPSDGFSQTALDLSDLPDMVSKQSLKESLSGPTASVSDLLNAVSPRSLMESLSGSTVSMSELLNMVSLHSLMESPPVLTASVSDLSALIDHLSRFDRQEFISGFSSSFPELLDFSKAIPLSDLQGLMSDVTARVSDLGDHPYQYFASELKNSLSGLSASVVRLSDLPNLFPESDIGNLLSGLSSSVSGLSDLPAMATAVDLPSLFSDLTGAVRAAFLPADVRGGKTIPSVQAPVNIHVTSHAASSEAVASSIYDTAQRSLLKTLESVFV